MYDLSYDPDFRGVEAIEYTRVTKHSAIAVLRTLLLTDDEALQLLKEVIRPAQNPTETRNDLTQDPDKTR
jgi:hypothetical protein